MNSFSSHSSSLKIPSCAVVKQSLKANEENGRYLSCLVKLTGAPGKSYTTRFSKYDNSILRTIWQLTPTELKLLDSNLTYILTVSQFLERMEPENFPDTYQDSYLDTDSGETVSYFITYLFCSGQYLEDLAEQRPETKIVVQLRANEANNFHHALVRLWDKKWSLEDMKSVGVRDLTPESVDSKEDI